MGSRRFPRWGKALLVLLGLVLVGPLLVPYPPVAGLNSPHERADADSLFLDVGGVEVHYKRYGAGQPVFLLLHGFGASEFSWHKVAGPLAEIGTVVTFDRPGFGLTERPMPGQWPTKQSPYSDSQYLALTIGLMDGLAIDRAILIGHSAGGSLAAALAAADPDRVQALILEAPALGGGHYQLSPVLRWLASTPQARRIGPWAARGMIGRLQRIVDLAWHDPLKLDETTVAAYHRPLTVVNWDRALWEVIIAPKAPADEIGLLCAGVPVLFVAGDDDRIVPTRDTVEAAGLVTGAGLVVVENCGHIPHEECPEEFMAAVRSFVGNLPAGSR